METVNSSEVLAVNTLGYALTKPQNQNTPSPLCKPLFHCRSTCWSNTRRKGPPRMRRNSCVLPAASWTQMRLKRRRFQKNWSTTNHPYQQRKTDRSMEWLPAYAVCTPWQPWWTMLAHPTLVMVMMRSRRWQLGLRHSFRPVRRSPAPTLRCCGGRPQGDTTWKSPNTSCVLVRGAGIPR